MNKSLAVVVFAWNGSRPIYKPWHVENMRRMVAKHLSLPHKFVVITDDPLPFMELGLNTHALWEAPKHENMRHNWIDCYRRLMLFDTSIGASIAERILAIDLDAVIRAPIDDLFEGNEPFKVMCMKSRTWLQGGLVRVDPGKVDPCPWFSMMVDEGLFERSSKWIGSDQAILSELFYDRVIAGEIPRWCEDDGISINEFSQEAWRIFFRTGHRKCWFEGSPEFAEYMAQSDRTDIPAELIPRIDEPEPRVPGGMTIQRRRKRGGGRGW